MPRFSSLKSFEQIKRSRKLAERSHMSLEFPQSDGRVFRTYIPFLSNPSVQERGQSNLIEYDLVGRPGSTFSYGGSKSRVVNLSFKINLLHTLYTASTEGIDDKFLRQFNLFFADKERAEKAFNLRPGGVHETDIEDARTVRTLAGWGVTAADPTGALRDQMAQMDSVYMDDPMSEFSSEADMALLIYDDEIRAARNRRDESQAILDKLKKDAAEDAEDVDNRDPDIKFGAGFPHAETHRNFYRSILGLTAPQIKRAMEDPAVDGVVNTFLEGIGADTIPTRSENLQRLNKLIDATYVWVNLIRASVMNNSTNTTQGPPLVRLQHGPMYNNVPFVVSDYNISIEDDAGYEAETLTPKELLVNMTLKEFRTNGSFVETQIESGDHICGWEAIIGGNNIDPYNGAIGESVLGVAQTTLGTGQGDSFEEAQLGSIGDTPLTGEQLVALRNANPQLT
tara:strand:- start:45 stop:1403 length:1359 start_codon:yes stop_codon:yes gene_type:complete